MKIQEILAEKWKQAQDDAKAKGSDADPKSVWDDFVKKWENEAGDKALDGKAPSLEELLAIMAAKSPTFEMSLMEYLWNHGDVRYKILASFEEGEIVGETAAKVGTRGKRFWNLWQSKIKLTVNRVWSGEEFAMFLTETSNAMFRAMNPEPRWYTTWASAFGRVFTKGELKMWKSFADKFMSEYRVRYKTYLETVSMDAFGEPRPEVVRSFYRFGMVDTIMRRLAVIKALFTGKVGSMKLGELIEWKMGLSPEELDKLFDGPVSKYLPRAVKDALMAAKNPEIYREILYNAEVERLSLEIMWFTRPIISALFLYYTVLDDAWGAYSYYKKKKEIENEIKKDPEKYIAPYKKADNARLSNLKDQLQDLETDKKEIEKEISTNPSMSPNDLALRKRSVQKLDMKIGKLNSMIHELENSPLKAPPPEN
jgi:hypothetical protein